MKRTKEICIAVVGGKLQGLEAVYLARKAGIKTLLIDKNPKAAASGLCDQFLVHEFAPDKPFPSMLLNPEVILPAIEDEAVLAQLEKWALAMDIPLLYDPHAYGISSSKKKSDTLFLHLRLHTPQAWPSCGFPLVLKPDKASGSMGVEIFQSQRDFEKKFPDMECPANAVAQEYLEGPSFSIEVMGMPGQYHALQVTDLGMDAAYDCNRVQTPTNLEPSQVLEMKEMSVLLAEQLCLKGIMDVEVIQNRGKLKILEIDARLPSQTPMAVYWSTGLNMVDKLVRLFSGKSFGEDIKKERPVLLEHIKVRGAEIHCLGEHIMGSGGPLTLWKNFFGADEAITNYTLDRHEWVATLIFVGTSQAEIKVKKDECFDKIKRNAQKYPLGKINDPANK